MFWNRLLMDYSIWHYNINFDTEFSRLTNTHLRWGPKASKEIFLNIIQKAKISTSELYSRT